MIWYFLQEYFSANESTAYSLIIIITILLNCFLDDIATIWGAKCIFII